MYSSVCPIGAPSRDYNRLRKSPQEAVSQRRPALPSSRSTRPQGMVFSINALPQEIKSLQNSQRNGIVFNVDDLPQDVKDLQLVVGFTTRDA
ncbi:hypothetical protein Pst134EA_007492 [Puccinia striiformis f. sp. tritici]|uniref:hypothetical protein n=1 Tax=Puccinia striiformis f. sp. tritici TaxID=168172 RepID=UPI002008B3A2|nr:hypothetical protein Pst134EA_007492 [Puccinia striiformis f. sp. tritici]KAH9470226.1 hypothetical protein Pst134EA_007492 [Puccinia striiformis f. sp. tritici]